MVESVTDLERGREFYSRLRWSRAYEALSDADATATLDADDLELLARSAYMLGRDNDYVDGLERAHHAHLEAGRIRLAVRCAFWIGHNLLFRGETAPAQGWFARGQRLLDRHDGDCVEHGYLRIAELLDHVFSGDTSAAETVASEIVQIGERFGDQDLIAMATMEQGHALVRQGQTEQGLQLVDETMVAVTTGELSPIVAGIVYCNTITFCRSVFELRRAREWTAALTQWCDEQPEMVAHNGQCLVHRAEIMTLEGAWPEALEELGRVEKQFTDGMLNQLALGAAVYQRGEVHRLRGEFEQAEAAYTDASHKGRQPQPGLALLRLAQDRTGDASAAIRRAVAETTRWADRASLLPAYVRIMLAVDDLDAAQAACRELEQIADRQDTDVLRARSAKANGAISLAEGDPEAALVDLRRAWRSWQGLGADHEAARVRVLIARCCRALGDRDTARLNLQAARRVFTELGAAPDLAGLDSLISTSVPDDMHGLTTRELEVVRLVAKGKSNKQVAAELVISEHTVARHLQNIYGKLNVSSRTAASAFAYEHGLIDDGQD